MKFLYKFIGCSGATIQRDERSYLVKAGEHLVIKGIRYRVQIVKHADNNVNVWLECPQS